MTPLPIKAAERHELRRRSFDTGPALYDRARPRYPEALFDDLVGAAGLRPGSRVLEIGPGPGIATIPLARRGLAIDAVELGDRMARFCRRKLRDFPQVTVHSGPFEEYDFEPDSFDCVFAASAFHWIPARTGFARARRALRPGGHLALVWLFRRTGYDRLQLELDRQYRRLGLKPWRARPPEERIERQRRAIERSGCFGPVRLITRECRETVDARRYILLLRTMSDHAILDPALRRRLFAGIRRVFARFGGTWDRSFLASLLLAPRRG